MDVRPLAARLIGFDTSKGEGLHAAANFIADWLREAGIAVEQRTHNDLPLLVAEVGSKGGPEILWHGHLDVVPARAGQFEPRLDGDRLIGRGAYDMKGALAAMLWALRDLAAEAAPVHVRLVCVADEESEDVRQRATDALVAEGLRADFAITGEPTDLQIGIEAKGVLALRVALAGTAAHGSTPWLGDNAILKAYDAFRAIETLPFSRASSEMFDRPSINLARIAGGDAFNKVPDACWIDVDIRYLPDQSPEEILAEIDGLGGFSVERRLHRAPASVSRSDPHVLALREAVARCAATDVLSVGRDGASDAISFIEAGVPAVEFGPVGGGHHGPAEWVSVDSLTQYRQALRDFVAVLPRRLQQGERPGLRAIEGGAREAIN